MIADPWNPSATEVREWAYTVAAKEPCQDWQLALSWARHEKTYLELVADDDCPNRGYFLDVLYIIVGDAVRSGFRSVEEPILRGFLERASEYDHKDIAAWRTRTIELLKYPDTFSYGLWCGGGYARGAT